MDSLEQYEIPKNSKSCFIARICEEPGDDFEKDGILWVDCVDIGDENSGPAHGEDGTTQVKAIASWSLRSAFIAWNKPPKLKFKGSIKMKGRITMSNAQLSNVTISGGPPLQGPVTGTAGVIPVVGNAVSPVTISAASGVAKIEQAQGAEVELTTDDNLDIELTSQLAAQLPWCVADEGASEGDDVDEGQPFIKKGDMALCMAFGNSLSNLYVIDIFR